MLPTSEAYRKMMLGPELRSRMVIDISNGRETTQLTNKDIFRELFEINGRASNNQAFSLGTTYAGSFNFSSFKRLGIKTEGDFLEIIPTIYYQIGNNQEEAKPLGVFRCDKPTGYAKTTSYECYDKMLAFDKAVPSRTSGTAYNLLVFICNKCGVPLGNTAQEIGAMINSGITLYINPDYIATYRDALSFISIILGGYAIMGRDGRLYIRQFHKTPDRTLSRKRVMSESFAVYTSYFYGVKCRFLADQNFAPYETSSSTREDGVVLDLGDIPIIEGTPAQKQAILDNIFEEIEDIEFTPATISMVGDPSIEPGDMITVKDRDGYDKNILLTSVTFNWRKECEILSEGSNPALGNVTTLEKRIKKSETTSNKNNQVVTTTYVNSGEITVGAEEPETITSLRFITNKSLTAIFGAEIPVYASGDGYVTIDYLDGGIQGDSVRARVHAGYNLITLVNHLYYDEGRVVLLKLNAQTEGISSGTAPTITIDQNTIRSYIFAQGIETEAPWDGIISIEESVEYIDSILEVYGLTEGISVTMYTPTTAGLSDIVAAIGSELNIIPISDTVEVGLEYGDQIMRMGQGHRAGAGRMFAPITI